MDEDLYDEFGNYIGPDLSDGDDDDENFDDGPEEDDIQPVSAQNGQPAPGNSEAMHDVEDDEDELEDAYQERGALVSTEDAGNAIVLPEDKRYYPTAMEVYGPDTEALVQEEDAQPITEPIIAPKREKKIDVQEAAPDGLQTTYDRQYLLDAVLSKPELVRNVAIAGHMHHGKTSLADLLIEKTHVVDWRDSSRKRYTDNRKDEQQRGISIKATPFTLLLPDLTGKSYGVNFIDTPGHLNFFDEVVASMRLCDGVLLVVDAAEGVMPGTEQSLNRVIRDDLQLTVVINKMDRLALELKLPPTDAFFKLRHIMNELNAIIDQYPGLTEERREGLRLAPDRGNVCFASAKQGWIFSIEQFAKMYLSEHRKVPLSAEGLTRRLWGDVYFDRSRKLFTKKISKGEDAPPRSFIEFILDPLYKLQSAVVGDDVSVLQRKMKNLGIGYGLKKKDFKSNVEPLLRLCMKAFFGDDISGMTSMLVRHIDPPSIASKTKVQTLYTGPQDSDLVQDMIACESAGAEFMALVAKLIPSSDGERFLAVARIMSGVAKPGDEIRVLGDAYDPDYDDEDQAVSSITEVYLPMSRYKTKLEVAFAGQIVLLEGVDSSINKGATLATVAEDENPSIFRPLVSSFAASISEPVVRVAIEPLRPSELPKMVEGLRSCNKSYPGLRTKVEESGEHVVLGSGELYLDCVLHDLRTVFGEIEVKVSDPCVPFCETISETSSLRCFAETPNKKNKLTFIAEPLEEGLAEDIETGFAQGFGAPGRTAETTRRIQSHFRSQYEWDSLAAKSLWAFGPDPGLGPNCILDDVIPGSGADKSVMASVQGSIVQGFQWATREGPLCDEPMRGVKCRILDASIAADALSRNGAQIIPTARRVTYSSFLTAAPRLMEPCYTFNVICPMDSVSIVYTLIGRRRGQVIEEVPKAGTPVAMITGHMPVLDSFGFETDLRAFSQGQAYCDQAFSHWAIVPGDPLDQSASKSLRPLEPAPNQALARECMVKTRRRKGMSEDIGIGKYFDDDSLLLELVEQDLVMENGFH